MTFNHQVSPAIDLGLILECSLSLSFQIFCQDWRGVEMLKRPTGIHRNHSCKASHGDPGKAGWHWESQGHIIKIFLWSFSFSQGCIFSQDWTAKICLTNYDFKRVQGRHSQQGTLYPFSDIGKLHCLTSQVKATDKNPGLDVPREFHTIRAQCKSSVSYSVSCLYLCQMSKPDI